MPHQPGEFSGRWLVVLILLFTALLGLVIWLHIVIRSANPADVRATWDRLTQHVTMLHDRPAQPAER